MSYLAVVLTVNLLGPPQAISDGVPVRVDTNKAIALLAYLVVERTARRDTLAALLWADSPQDRARATLRRTLSALRTAAGGDLVQSDRSSIALAGEVVSDYGQLMSELEATTTHGHDASEVCSRCVPHLERASSLYRGDFLQGFNVRSAPEFESWSRTIAQSVRIRMESVFERLASALAAAGNYVNATAAAARWIELDPLHEPAYRLLMLLRAWAGDRPGSIDAYRECVAVLDRELAVAPLEETTELYEAILDEDLPPAPGVRRRVAATQVSARAPAGLIDREAELQALRGALQTARDDGLVVALSGAPWMGKTRLTEELVADASDDWVVLSGRGFRMEQELPYGLVAQLLGQAVDRIADASLPPWALGELNRLVPGLGPVAARDPLGERRMLEAIHTALIALATERPLLLIVDDAQWVDEPSAGVIAYLARRLPGTPVLLVVVAREDEGMPSPLAEVLAGASLRLALQPLSFEQLLPLTANDEAAARVLETRTGGVPLLAAEAVATENGPPTPGMTRYLETRWQELGDLERQLLSAAAVLGGTCDTRLLRETSGRSEEEVVDGVERLIRLGLLQETPDGVGFTLDAMERVAYESVSLVRRRLLHGRAAEALSAQPNARREARGAAAVAAQYQAAGRPEAAGWHLTAGDLARSVYAHDSARSFYEAAIALGTDRIAAARIAIAEVEMAAGRYDEARRQLTLAESAGDHAAAIRQRLGDVERLLGRFEAAEEHYRFALEMGAPPVEVLSDWALLAMRIGRTAQAAELATEARSAAEKVGRQAELSRVRNILAAVTSDPDSALAHAEEAERLAGEDEMLLMAALNSQALILAEKGELDRAVKALEDAILIAQRTGHRHREAALQSHLGDIHHRAGREDEAREFQTRAVSIFSDIDAGGFEPELWLLTRW